MDREKFTNQEPMIVTEEDCKAPWGGVTNGKRFRCYLCGHKFKPGDYWRWVYGGVKGLINLTVCESCDGDDVLERWKRAHEEFEQRFWWTIEEEQNLSYDIFGNVLGHGQ